MKRALFMNELQRALIVQVWVIVAVWVLIAGGIYFSVPPQAVVFPLIIIIFSAIVAGGIPFARGFQQKQWPLLLTLPISRGTVWALIVVAHALAALISNLAVVVVLRLGPRGSGELTIPLLSLYWLFFAGATGSILVGPEDHNQLSWKSLTRILAGIVPGCIQFGAVFQIPYISAKLGLAPTQPFIDSNRPLIDGIRLSDINFLLFGFLVLIIGILLITRSAFIHSETHLPSTKLRYNLIAFGFLVAVALVSPFAADVFALFDDWSFHQAAASGDGRHLAVFERESRHPSYGRLTTIDLQSGAAVSTIKRRGIRSITWSAAGSTLNATIESRALAPPLLRFLRTRDHVVTFSPDLREVADLTEDEVVALLPLPNETILVVTRDQSRGPMFTPGWMVASPTQSREGSVLSWSAGAKRLDPLVTGQLDGSPILYGFGDKTLIDFANVATPSTLWRTGQTVTKLKLENQRADLRPRTIIGDTVYTVPKSARETLIRTIPPPISDASSANYLISPTEKRVPWVDADPHNQPVQAVLPPAVYVDASTYLFYIAANAGNRTGALFAFDQGVKQWKRFEEALVISEDEQKFLTFASQALASVDRLSGVAVDSMRGIAAYLAEPGGELHLRVYDSAIDKLIDLGSIRERAPGGKVEINGVTGLNGVLILYRDLAFIYAPGSGNASPIKLAGPYPDLLYLNADGSQVYRDSATGKILQKSANQPERVIWPK